MRIIGGSAKGRKLISPKKSKGNDLIRPTSSKARESIFNIIANYVDNATVLDLFAGTGAMGLEALSRNAKFAVFVDNTPKSLALILKNISLCNFLDKSTVIQLDLTNTFFPSEKIKSFGRFDLIFIDPPYHDDFAERLLLDLDEVDMIKNGGLVIVEIPYDRKLINRIGNLAVFDKRRYGQAGFWLYEKLEV